MSVEGVSDVFLRVLSQLRVKLVDAAWRRGLYLTIKWCLDSGVESVDAVKRRVSKSGLQRSVSRCLGQPRDRSMQLGVVGVRIALSITKMGVSRVANE